jgi:poly-gamma-glutamate capsule biosynthesis protein CapA/YwtB (metallophosphatase superfamily)
MRFFFLILFISASTSLWFFPSGNKSAQRLPTDSVRTVTLSFVGDLMCHSPQMDYAKVGKDSFDFKPTFSEVKEYLSSADITFGNLETTLTGAKNKYSGYPLFNSPDEFLDALKDCGFDFLFTSNNHCLDRGKNGVLSTIEKIHSVGLQSTGTFNSEKDRDSIRIINVNGMSLAVLAYTYGTNGNPIPKNGKYLVNLIDTLLVKKDIQTAKSKNVDAVLVYYHFGEEYQRVPNTYQKEIVERTISYGANIIIGSHPHVIQGAEYFSSMDEKFPKGFVAYSLGNFISNQRWRYSDCGVILTIKLQQNLFKKAISITDASIIPTWVYKGKVEDSNRFLILPSDTSVYKLSLLLSPTDKSKLLQSYSDTWKLFDSIKQKHVSKNEPSNH